MDYGRLVQQAIDEHRSAPVDLLGIGDAEGEVGYLNVSRASYVRTVSDLDGLFPAGRAGRRILELGAFLGPVSVALKELGYGVDALDIPEFHSNPRLQALYARHGIAFAGCNLRLSPLPYETGSFDAVALCEVMEHWNFNPLPALAEVNRVLKPGGCIYLAMPNQASVVNRVKLLFGRSVHNPVGDFFKQLGRSHNMVVGLHWREYTLPETVELLQEMGFGIASKDYYIDPVRADASLLRKLARAIVFSYPPMRPSQVVVGRKLKQPEHDFWRTQANA